MNEVSARLLRASLRARGPADPSPECLDAETVAAWADDTLGREERRAAEAHAADCGRCQALVAALVQTAPPAAVRSWWRAPVMGWLVPLTAGAAALLVWISVPGTSRKPASTVVSSAIEQNPTRPAVGEASNRPQDSTLPPPGRPDAAAVNSRGDTKGARSGSPGSAAEKRRTEPAGTAKALAEAARDVAAPAPSMSRPAIPASPPPQQASADAAAAPAPPVPPVSVQRTAAARLGSANPASLLLDARRFTTVIVSPNRTSQWRLLANGAVQRSADGGTTWEVQPTGVTVMLTAGASPAPSICWLVGPQGIVLLSTDGRSWRRIAFPESGDLTSVRATDDKSATVNTADGRAFSTIDGGQSWIH